MLDPHTAVDLEFYFAFLLGQLLFLLKRASSAIRNPKTTVTSRKDFFYKNWDIISVRTVIETILVYYPFRHYSIAQIIKLFGMDLTATENPWLQFITTVPSSAISAVGIGYAADSLLDTLGQWKRLPSSIKDWIAENVPTIPLNVQQKPAEAQDAAHETLPDKPLSPI